MCVHFFLARLREPKSQEFGGGFDSKSMGVNNEVIPRGKKIEKKRLPELF